MTPAMARFLAPTGNASRSLPAAAAGQGFDPCPRLRAGAAGMCSPRAAFLPASTFLFFQGVLMTGLRYCLRIIAMAVGGLTILLFSAGCSEFTYVPVKGKVVLKNKKPVTRGMVVFVPDKDNRLRTQASGVINEDGSYELRTDSKYGVPIGSYIACVRWPIRRVNGIDPPPSPFSMKYFDSNESPLKIEVVASPAPGAYDLEVAEK